MSPDFGDLVGRDIEEGERARLEHVHDLLVAAGPPPEYVVAPPAQLRPRRRRAALLAIAAALAVASFAAGAAVVDHWGGPNVDFTVTMTGTASATNATGSLVVFDIDAAGNWPMKLKVDGLPPATGDKTFELWLQDDSGTMVPAGLMNSPGDNKVLLKGDAAKATGVGITVEPEGGSKEPTSEPIALFDFSQAT